MKSNIQKLWIFITLLWISMSASAYDIEVDGICYNLNMEERTAEVASKNGGYSGEIVIPSHVEAYSNLIPVVAIGKSAFSECTVLTKVELPNTIIEIKEYAFYRCKNLISINIPSSVEKIGLNSFKDSALTRVDITDLESWLEIYFALYSNPLSYAHHLYLNGKEVTHVDVPEGFTYLAPYVFSGCYGLESISLPSTLQEIGSGSLNDCINLKMIDIPDSVSIIGGSAFSGCTSLADIELPQTLNSIGDRAFENCSSFKGIIIPEGITDIENYTFSGCDNLYTVEIPNTMKTIGKSAFRNSGIGSIKIPSSVTEIGASCFDGCSKLSHIVFENSEKSLKFDYFNYPNSSVYYYVSFKSCPIKDIYIGRDMSYGTYSPFYENRDIEIITIGVNASNIYVLYGNNSDNSKFTDLKVINCCSKTPINVPKFTIEQYATVQVNVPYGALETYKKHSIWGKFWNIQEKEYEEAIYPEEISLNINESEIQIGEAVNLKVTISPDNVTDNTVTWSSSDDSIATVSEDGLVTGVSLGETVITATCGHISATCTVVVTEATGVENIISDESSSYSVYTVDGRLVKNNCRKQELKYLSKGIYIIVSEKGHYKISI